MFSTDQFLASAVKVSICYKNHFHYAHAFAFL
jgi:hypothetical protein